MDVFGKRRCFVKRGRQREEEASSSADGQGIEASFCRLVAGPLVWLLCISFGSVIRRAVFSSESSAFYWNTCNNKVWPVGVMLLVRCQSSEFTDGERIE
jgi:hypothetical protein